MENIIVKKVQTWINRSTGFVKPLFRVVGEDQFEMIGLDEYPNNGRIVVHKNDELNNWIFGNIFEIQNPYFIQDDFTFQNRANDPYVSQKRIGYNSGIQKHFYNLLPQKLIQIFDNQFDIEKQKLLNTEGIFSDIFFLKKDDSYYGPFERAGLELRAAKFTIYNDSFNDDDDEYKEFYDNYLDYNGSFIRIINDADAINYIIEDNEGCQYFINLNQIVKNQIGDLIEYSPYSELQEWVLNGLKKADLQSNEQASGLMEFINNNFKISEGNNKLDSYKWKKYKEYIEQFEGDNVLINDIIEIIRGKFIKDSVSNVISESEKLEKAEEIRLKDEEIVDLKNQINELSNQSADSTQSLSNIDEKVFPHLFSYLDKSEKILELEAFLKLEKSRNDLEIENGVLNKLKKEVEANIKDLERERDDLKIITQKITSDFTNTTVDHTKKLFEAKYYTDLLNGINIKPMKEVNNEDHLEINVISAIDKFKSAREYIQKIEKSLLRQGRKLPFNDIANLIITFNQSFITIIAGAPGVGKTSLVEKIAQSYGLNETYGYLGISCSRGWSSSKDLIGFFNPLTNKFQSSKTKLKEALEKSSKFKNAPYVVLLDEANLSPIEHYWSDFIKLADNDYERKLKLSDSEEIEFGDGFRFVATINHDHTTEQLSSRLIDRASIILLSKGEFYPSNNDLIYEDIFDFHDIQTLFKETEKWKSDGKMIQRTLNEIKKIIEDNGIVVSHRKDAAIIKYCEVATGLIDGNIYAALDYAVAQHILPLINLRGEKFESELSKLQILLRDKGMFKSEGILDRIIKRGHRDFKHYKFIFY